MHSLLHHVHTKGIWILTDLPTYEMIHYPRAFCHINNDNKTITIIDNMGTVLNTVELRWFNITWNYDKDYLIRACEKRLFQYGINESRRIYEKII